MNNPLFFISIIAKALDAPDRKKALKSAMNSILEFCATSPSDVGCLQFREFLNEAAMQWDFRRRLKREMVYDLSSELALQIALDTFEGSHWERRLARELIESDKSLQDVFVKLPTMTRESRFGHTHLKLILSHDDKILQTWPIESGRQHFRFQHIPPGRLNLSLSTGRCLWSENLEAEDLIWSYAHPDRDLPMAADTGEIAASPTKEIVLCNEALTIRVFPGIENGWVEISIEDLK